MSLSQADIEHIAHLARLDVDAGEMPEYLDKLTRILEFVERLSEVATDDVDPMAHPLEMSQRLREDAVIETNQRELFQQNARAVENGLYTVPRVVE